MTSNGIHERSISNAHDLASPSVKEKYSSSDEDVIDVELNSQDDNDGESASGGRFINTDDPFPIDPNAPVEERQLTIRALLVGCLLGAIIAASNVYLGLKVCGDMPFGETSLMLYVLRRDGHLERQCLDQYSVWLFVSYNTNVAHAQFRRLRYPETLVYHSSTVAWRWLLWTQGKQCVPSCGIRCW